MVYYELIAINIVGLRQTGGTYGSKHIDTMCTLHSFVLSKPKQKHEEIISIAF